MSFDNLKEKFGIPQTQIRSFIHSRWQFYECTPVSTTEKLASADPYVKGKISILYKNQVETSSSLQNRKIMAWIKDLQKEILEHKWERACDQAQTLSFNSRLLIQK